MRFRRPFTAVLAAATLLTVAAAEGDDPAAACSAEGEVVTDAEVHVNEFNGAAFAAVGSDAEDLAGVPYPEELASQADVHFDYTVAFTNPEAERGNVDIRLDWDNPGDFDLDVFDADGNVVAESHSFNPLDGNGEAAQVAAQPCDQFTVRVRNYMGPPNEPLTLTIEVVERRPRR